MRYIFDNLYQCIEEIDNVVREDSYYFVHEIDEDNFILTTDGGTLLLMDNNELRKHFKV